MFLVFGGFCTTDFLQLVGCTPSTVNRHSVHPVSGVLCAVDHCENERARFNFKKCGAQKSTDATPAMRKEIARALVQLCAAPHSCGRFTSLLRDRYEA